MVRLWLLDQYDDAELDRKKVAAMFAGFVTRRTLSSTPRTRRRDGWWRQRIDAAALRRPGCPRKGPFQTRRRRKSSCDDHQNDR
jgi:capsid protein